MPTVYKSRLLAMETEQDDLSIVKTVSLTSALERQLERLIVTGELEPGDRLNEIQLSRRFGISRGPLREAMRSLEAKGFVDVIRNRGVFVRRLSLEEAKEIYDVRSVLFGLAGRLAAGRKTDELVNELKELMTRMDLAAGNQDVDAYYHLNLEFHCSIVEASGNKTLINEYNRLVTRLHLFRVKGLVLGGGLSVSNDEHASILAAIESGDPDRAQAATMHHVQQGKQRVTAAVSSLPPSSKSD